MKTTRFAGVMATAGALSLVTLATAARADETEIPLDQLPKAVADAAKAKFPGAKWREAAKETEDGRVVYEVALTHEGRRMDVTFQADGTLVLVETEVPEAALPATVLRTAKEKYPGAKIDLAESVKKGPQVKKEADYYELHLTTADKRSVEIEVDGAGKILKTESGGKEEGKG
ncbi:MAG: PepSY-like domain-containing protein [Isosphaeraceae bacterium]|nr:PepSY-like domain-containing protein [Isosphaeraceae bacterium]